MNTVLTVYEMDRMLSYLGVNIIATYHGSEMEWCSLYMDNQPGPQHETQGFFIGLPHYLEHVYFMKLFKVKLLLVHTYFNAQPGMI